MIKLSLSLITLLLTTSISFSQSPGIQWQQTMGTKYYDNIDRMIKTSDGGFLIAAEKGTDDTYEDLWVIKKNAEGITEWEKTYGGAGYDYVYGMVETRNHEYILIGSSTSTELPGHHGVNPVDSLNDEVKRDAWLLKISNNGQLLWQKFIGGKSSEEGAEIVAIPNGEYLIAGWTDSKGGDFLTFKKDTSNFNSDGFIAKINESGQLLLLKCFGGKDEDYFNDIINDGDNLIVTGATFSNDGDVSGHKLDSAGNYLSAFRSDAWVVRIDTSLTIQKQKCFGGGSIDDGMRIKKISSNKYLFIGTTYSTDGDVVGYPADTSQGYNTADGWIFEMDSSWSIKKQKVVGGNDYDQIYDADLISDDGYIVCGMFSYNYTNEIKSSAWLIKLDSNYNVKWDYKLGGSGQNYFSSCEYISPDKIYFGGYAEVADGDVASSVGLGDCWLIRFGAVNYVTGTAFIDANNNTKYDAGERRYKNLKIQSEKGSAVNGAFTDDNGQFKITSDTGTYITKPINANPYYTISPVLKTTSHNTYFNTDTVDFALTPIVGKKDLVVSLFPLIPARPGFDVSYKITYFNRGTTTIPTGLLKFKKDTRLNFVSATPVNTTTSGDTLMWNFSNFKPFDTTVITVNLKVASPPTVNIGDTLRSIALLDPVAGDETPNDDTTVLIQRVQGSYDPNDKTELHGGKLTPPQLAGKEYLTYLIRFQNTGTDTAFNIFVRDTLDAKLDWNSLEMLGSSHNYNLAIKDGNKLEWFFTNIKLVDSTTNEKASHGYIAYRIKPKTTLVEGDSVTNRASIYFDFNLPVNTNSNKTFIRSNIVTAVIDLNRRETQLYLYPNPASNLVMVAKEGRLKGNAILQIRDVTGRLLRQINYGNVSTESFRKPVDLKELPNGSYMLQLSIGKAVYTGKLIIQ